MPELLRVVKLLGSSDSEASATEMLQIPVSLWQALVPQLLSLLVSNKVCLQPSELNENLCVSQSKRSQPSLHQSAMPLLQPDGFCLSCKSLSHVMMANLFCHAGLSVESFPDPLEAPARVQSHSGPVSCPG